MHPPVLLGRRVGENLNTRVVAASWPEHGEGPIGPVIGEATSVSRHHHSDIFLEDITVSRRHAEFRRVDTGVAVVDVGASVAPTSNGAPVEALELADGDIQIGKFRLKFSTP